VKRPSWRSILLSVVTILLALIYLRTGLPKLAGSNAWIRMFERWGYPDWLLLAVGTVEVAGAVLLLMPRTALYGAAALGAVMLGALYTHATEGAWAQCAVPLVLLCLLAAVAGVRRRKAAP
jgi:uncharacterized membrane protein YphA (DoxX/SURF4 family)